MKSFYNYIEDFAQHLARHQQLNGNLNLTNPLNQEPKTSKFTNNSINHQYDKITTQFNQMYPLAGHIVDGREVLPNIDNTSSISASLTDYHILKGIRDFPIHGFGGKNSFHSADDVRKVDRLMQQIKNSNQISPIIIVEEKNGPYILEGAHRMAALVELKAKSIPALIVLDMESLI